MSASAIPSVRVLNDFHAEVKHITANCNFHASELRNARRLFIAKTKELQDLRGVVSLISHYYSKTTPATLSEICQVPVVQSHTIHACERLLEITSLPQSVRSDIPKFLKQLYAQAKKLPELFASLGEVNESPPYLPNSLRVRDFLGCSTIPALFGYYWTVELQLAFIQFVSDVADHLPASVFQSLHEHWLIDVIRNYVLASDIDRFFAAAATDIVAGLCKLKDPTWGQVMDATRALVNSMLGHMALFPADVRYLLKRVSESAQAQERRLATVEMLFMYGVLLPALANPKAYGLIPRTVFADLSLPASGRALTNLGQVFLLILHVEQAAAKFQDPGGTSVVDIPFETFLNRLIDVTEGELSGPRLLDLVPVGGSHFILVTFSLPDVYLLVEICERVGVIPQLADFAKKFPLRQTAPFEFFRYENWDFASYGLKKPPMPEIEMDKPPNLAPSAAAAALYKFLAFANIDKNAPPGYEEFTEYYEKNMITWQMYDTEVYLRHLYVIYNGVPAEDRPTVLPALEDEMRRHNKFLDAHRRGLTEISHYMRELAVPLRRISGKLEIARSSLANQILTLFLQANPTVISDLKTSKEDIQLQKTAFKTFFTTSFARMKKFVQPYGEHILPDVARLFHSYLMQFLPFSEFQVFHRQFERCDKHMLDVADEIIIKGCISPAPERIRTFFASPELFLFAIHSLRRATVLQLPLEALAEIADCFDLLTDLYGLESDGPPSHADLTPLFNFAVLTCRTGTILSLFKYIEHYTSDLLPLETPVLSERLKQALYQLLPNIPLLDGLMAES
jgi:hypothetical protein